MAELYIALDDRTEYNLAVSYIVLHARMLTIDMRTCSLSNEVAIIIIGTLRLNPISMYYVFVCK